MHEQATRLSGECQSCGAPAGGWAVQVVRDGRLRWEVDWECSACRTISCDWGWGPAVDWLRDELLAQHGPYWLKLTDPEVRGGQVLKAFRGALGLSLGEAQQAARTMRRSGYTATYVEVRLLADLLRQEGIDSEVGPGACA
jgi:hypothetical protein